MPSPPGGPSPLQGAPLRKGAPGACAAERRTGVCGRLRPATGPGGEGILPSLCAARRIGFEGGFGQARLAARARARCPRPQGPVAIAGSPHRKGAPGACAAERRTESAGGCGQRRDPGGEGILPSLCAARRIGFEGGLGHARLAARARARCPRPQRARRHCKEPTIARARQGPVPWKGVPESASGCGQ